MRIYDIAFYFCVFFLVGILLHSLQINLLMITLLAVLAAIFILARAYLIRETINSLTAWLAGLTLIMILGAFYAASYDSYHAAVVKIDFGKTQSFKGVVIADPEKGQSQKLKVALQESQSGNILVTLRSYPAFNYGDLIEFDGSIQSPDPGNYAEYLAKENIYGASSFPKTRLISSGNGSVIYSALFDLKNKIISVFQKTLSQERAAFLSGITLGEQAEFSKELKAAMSRSGTTHLVALSGYNISIISWSIAGILGLFLSRRWTFALSIFIIIGFVLMTGAQASVVRAAIMGIIFLVAGQVGRAYSSRNAIVLAAFFMVLINPLILRFDIGFQLSFLALLGLVYLSPVIKQILGVKDNFDFLSFKENLLATLSAQLAVAPFLIINFGNFSPISLLTNILILSFIPITMALGFLIGFLWFIFSPLSFILAWLTSILLGYELAVIKFFGSFSFMKINSLSLYLAVIYYLVLIAFVIFSGILTKQSNFKTPQWINQPK